jgi:CDP-diacylglycerol--serine O-phosphatidyltransferase
MFNLANVFTAANMISGIVAILFAFMGRIDLAPIAIFAGAFFDFFDGFIARKTGSDGELGKQLDSLADMITFGVAPGMIMLVIMTMNVPEYLAQGHHEMIRYDFFDYLDDILSGEVNYSVPFFALTIPFFALFRLAKFNIDTRQTESFIGLPTPANTLFFMTFPLVLSYGGLEYNETVELLFDPITLSVLIVGMSIMMVVNLPLFSLKFKSFKWKSNEIRYVFLLISSVLILLFKTWSIALIVFLYLNLSIIENLFFKKKEHEI